MNKDFVLFQCVLGVFSKGIVSSFVLRNHDKDMCGG